METMNLIYIAGNGDGAAAWAITSSPPKGATKLFLTGIL